MFLFMCLSFYLGSIVVLDDPSIIEEGVSTVKRILADNYVRPDEAQEFFLCFVKEVLILL